MAPNAQSRRFCGLVPLLPEAGIIYCSVLGGTAKGHLKRAPDFSRRCKYELLVYTRTEALGRGNQNEHQVQTSRHCGRPGLAGRRSAAFAAGPGTNVLTAAQQQPGLTAGLSTGTPLPTGVYEVGILDWGTHANTAFEAGVLIPINLIWSTPWEILGGRPFFQFANAEAYVAKNNTPVAGHSLYLSGNFENVLGVGMGWNLGNGFRVTIEEEYYPGIATRSAPQDYAHVLAGRRDRLARR